MTGPYRILVCGSRRWVDKARLALAIGDWLGAQGATIGSVWPVPTVVHGGAAGADMLAGSVARNWGWREEIRPDGDLDGADVLLSFPVGPSPDTRGRMLAAEAAGIPVVDCTAAVTR